VRNDKKLKPDSKKGFPGGFFIFLLAAILIIMTMQSLSSGKMANVSFSHQLEHLINLDMIRPEDSRMTAHNNNLVTFSGKFKQALSEDSKNRYRYLQLLNEQDLLKNEKSRIKEETSELKENVRDNGQYFLSISGTPIPSSGYVVVSSTYDMPRQKNAVVIYDAPLEQNNFQALSGKFSHIANAPIANEVQEYGANLLQLVKMFRSPALGIGDEQIKKTLKGLEETLRAVPANAAAKQKIATYKSTLSSLENIVSQMNQSQDSVRLFPLRSVRTYVDKLQQDQILSSKLEENSSLLERAREKVANVIWFFNNKEISTSVLEEQNSEEFRQWFSQAKAQWENFESNKGLVFKAPDQPRSLVLNHNFKTQEQSPNYFSYILTILPVVVLILLLYFLFSKQMKGVGSNAMNFGKSPARLMTKETNKITFKDVAGAQEAKEELHEVVDFLKDPKKFTALGARIPKGVLLIGPPGTGKTLVAKAVAGEADRPFFSISGSDFVEMFVGVGASRIRDLFDQAKKNAPCIIFMDEIDAVGRHRGAGIGGGHDEREQTLNQLLVEMDGFDTKEGVILMAATNRPDILDRALLRPGRFDRRVTLDLPDVNGRYEILKVHARKIKIDSSVELMDVARSTPGASGADLENILNEAALIAARNGRKAVTSTETIEACDKVRFGKERRSLEMDEEEKRTTAYHESGHTIVGLTVENADPVDKVTIIPRGFSLGATHFMPKKNRLSYWRKEAIDQLAVLMGGRAAEEEFIGDLCSGAKHDISQATKLARAMVCEWGMSENIGLVSFDEQSESSQYLGVQGYHEKKYSEETAKKIDDEINRLIEDGHKKALEIVRKNKDKVQLMADMLMEFETLDANDIKEIMEETWDADKKRERLKAAEELHKNSPPPPPNVTKPKEEQNIQRPEKPEPNMS
jgi:cell division protease FtsH